MTQSISDAAQALLPCPFCGHSKNIAMANTHHDHSGGYYIGCPECGASTELVFALMDDPRQILVEKWNRRVALSTPQPTADERVAEHMDLVYEAGSAAFLQNDDAELAAMKAVEQSARALLSASQDDVVAGNTSGFVCQVPDHCDRIVWRNRYYHLPLKVSQQPSVQQ